MTRQGSGNDNWRRWRRVWALVAEVAKERGELVEPLSLKAVATADEIASAERTLRVSLPESFKTVLLDFSGGASCHWELSAVPLGTFPRVMSGGVNWGLGLTTSLDPALRELSGSVPPDRPGHDRLRDSIPLTTSHYGDGLLGLDLRHAEPPVVRLDRAGVLTDQEALVAHNFIDFLENWTLVACAGPEDWILDLFIPEVGVGIDPTCSNAQTWREWLGIDSL